MSLSHFNKNVDVGFRFLWFRFMYFLRCATVYMHVFVVCTHVVNTNTDVVREVGEHVSLSLREQAFPRLSVAGCARDQSFAYDPV